MATDFDRDDSRDDSPDQSIDRLLKGARRGNGEPDAVSDACVDAETLAAWAENALPPSQARAVEAHLAGCARCQAIVAAFAASDETAISADKSAAVVPFRRLPLKYVLPIAGTLAATLVIWIGVRDREALPVQFANEAKSEQAAPVPASPSPEPQLQARNEPAPTPSKPPASAKSVSTDRRQRLDAAEAELARRMAKTEPLAATPAAKPVAAQPPPPPMTVAAPPPTVSVMGQTAATSNAARPNEAVFRATIPPVIAEFSSDTALRDATIGAGAASRVAGNAGRGGAAGRVSAPARALETVQPIPPAHWRIIAPDVLQKSSDKAAWETIAIDPPAQGLSGGAAPSGLVCWLIGKNGLVLLSTDGRKFARVTPPTTADLASIKAIDARHAMVTTADGQTFTTTDAGKSWTKSVRPMQGFRPPSF